MFSGAGAGSRKNIPGAGAASKQDGSETLIGSRLKISRTQVYILLM